MRDYDSDRDSVIRRAFAVGVDAMLSIGIDLSSSRDSIELAGRYTGVYATVGFHPHDASGLDDSSYGELTLLGRQPKVVAVGEIGLDFYRNLSPREVQLAAFQRQLDLASQLGLPVVVHDRDAHREIVSTLKRWVASTPTGSGRWRGVIHCFSGDLAFAEECLALGFLISLSGTVTYPNAVALAEIARSLPLEYLLVETDSPFLSPHPYRSKRNEPSNARSVAEKIAALRGIGPQEVAEVTTRNAVSLFGLGLSDGPA